MIALDLADLVCISDRVPGHADAEHFRQPGEVVGCQVELERLPAWLIGRKGPIAQEHGAQDLRIRSTLNALCAVGMVCSGTLWDDLWLTISKSAYPLCAKSSEKTTNGVKFGRKRLCREIPGIGCLGSRVRLQRWCLRGAPEGLSAVAEFRAHLTSAGRRSIQARRDATTPL